MKFGPEKGGWEWPKRWLSFNNGASNYVYAL